MTTAATIWGEALVAVLLLLCVSTPAGAGFSRSQADKRASAATEGDIQYDKSPLVPTGDQQRPVSQGVVAPQTGPSLDGRNYYLLGEEVTCRANAPGYPRIKSWKNRLEFFQENVLIWQTICNDNPIIQKFDPQQFTIADDLSYVIYKAEKYTYYEKAPKLCENGQWCPAEEGQ
jgi:hypothetical protein